MCSFDLGDIQEAGCTANKATAGECQLGNGLETTLIQRPGAIGHTAATFENVTNGGVCLEPLEFFKRRQMGV